VARKFRNKYRIASTRISWFDYGSNAAYYITICTKNRKPYLGLVENDFMVLSEIGEIVKDEWHKTPSIRPELNLYMDDLIIAPDHIHGVIIRRDARPGVSTNVRNKNSFGAQTNNIPSIIRGIKSAVTIQARKINPDFGWQTRYYDHIIRNRKDYRRILEYLNKHPQIVL
jgi:putative transposase